MRPNHPLAFVVDDDGDVRVAFPVAGLVHADRREPVEHAWHAGFRPAGDPSGDVARGPPRDMQETAHGLPVGDRHQPRAFQLEVAREPAARLRPRNPRHHHAMHTAFHTRSRTHELDPIAAEVLVPPTPFAAPVVVFRAYLRPQREQRNAAFLHLTRATRTGASRSGESSMDTSSTTMPLTLSKRLNMFFIRRFLWFFFLVEKQTYRKRPSHPHNQRLNDETTPTKTTQEPEMVTLHLEELLPMCDSSKRFPRL